jgi:hypothetical protein
MPKKYGGLSQISLFTSLSSLPELHLPLEQKKHPSPHPNPAFQEASHLTLKDSGSKSPATVRIQLSVVKCF